MPFHIVNHHACHILVLRIALNSGTLTSPGDNPKTSERCPQDHPPKAQDVHIHCTLDPVEVKLSQSSSSTSSDHYLQDFTLHRRRQRQRKRRRRCSPRHYHKCRGHKRGTCARPHPCSHQRRRFPPNGSVFRSKQHCHRMMLAPSSDREDLESYLEEEESLSYPRPKNLQSPWGPLCKRVDLAPNVDLWGCNGGILASLPPPSLYLSPELRLMPKRVEAKSELRLQQFRPHCSQTQVWDNMEAEQPAPCPPPPQRLPHNSSLAPGAHTPYPSKGQLLYDSWQHRRHGLPSSEPPLALLPRSSPPEVQEPHSSHCHRRSLPSSVYSQPNRSHHSSMGHLSHNTHDIRRRATELCEAPPVQHVLTTSTSLNVLNDSPCQQGSVPTTAMQPHYVQPLPEVQPAEPPPPAPTFMPLSRSPGVKANHQVVYDSVELKRQVQENRARTNSLPPPSLASKSCQHWGRNMKRI